MIRHRAASKIQTKRDEPVPRAPWTPRRQNVSMAAELLSCVSSLGEDPSDDELHRLSLAIHYCGRPTLRVVRGVQREIAMRSGRHILCDACAEARRYRYARAAAARAMYAFEQNDALQFILFTLALPEMEDLNAQLELAWSCLDGLRRSRRHGAKLLEGLSWHIEIETRRRECWRSHVHAIGVVTKAGWDTEKAVLLRWIDLSQPGLRGKARSRALESQYAAALWMHGRPDMSTVEQAIELGRDVYAATKYAAKPLRLTPEQRRRAFAVVNGRKLHDSFGVFRLASKAKLPQVLDRYGGSAVLTRTRTDNPTSRPLFDGLKRRTKQRRDWVLKVRSDGRATRNSSPVRSTVTAPSNHHTSTERRPGLKQRLLDAQGRRSRGGRADARR